ncbi:MAG: ComF family protein [Dorea sp.]|nr:ComF family protein [Dorea sp.]
MGERAVTWLWPEICPFCGRVSSQGICTRCRGKLESIRIREPRCMKCSKPLGHEEQEYCYDCMRMKHWYTEGYGLWLHKDPVSTSIYQFKYHDQRRFGICFAEELVCYYGHTIMGWKPDLIIPIPLHKKRRRKRGYNQAEILSRRIGEILRIPVDHKSLVRRVHTDPQKKLGHQERKKNLKHAFSVRRSFSPVDTVLLIDDIYTTGSTIDAAARVLKEKGVEKVYFLTISIGQGY